MDTNPCTLLVQQSGSKNMDSENAPNDDENLSITIGAFVGMRIPISTIRNMVKDMVFPVLTAHSEISYCTILLLLNSSNSYNMHWNVVTDHVQALFH